MNADVSATLPRQGRGELPGFALMVAQLLLVALVLSEWDLLTEGFRRVIYLAVAGFVVNHLLPAAWRLRFFVLLSVGAIFLAMGGSYTLFWDLSAAWPRAAATLAVVAAVIGICLLPAGYWTRATLLVALAGVMGVFRWGLFGSGRLDAAWTAVYCLFLFRAIIYLYDVSTSIARPDLVRSAAYFLCIPSVCSPNFPQIDFKTFYRSHYNGAPLEIYQRGVRWITRGIIQLLVYRFVVQLRWIEAGSVDNGTDVIRYVIVRLFSYLSVSGVFTLIVGFLLLFGFNLPEIYRRFFLASSFTDYWRRINIYWKDFVMKVFYYPTFFKLKKSGQTRALIIATLWCFFVSWALHATARIWWHKDLATITWPDTLFWFVFGVLVAANALWEMKRGRPRKLVTSRYRLAEAGGLMLRTAATFAVMGVLWSLYVSESLSSWIHVWRQADVHTLLWGAAILAAIMVATLLFEVVPTWLPQRGPAAGWLRNGFLQSAPALLLLFLLAHPLVLARLEHPRLQRLRVWVAQGDSKLGDWVAGNRGYMCNRQYFETLMRQQLPEPRPPATP